jgi:hypothetical protein
MKNLSLALSVLALGLVSMASAHAQQDAGKYDPIMEKRADLRVKYQRTVREAAKQQPEAPPPETNDIRLRLHRSHVNDSYMVDFMARSAKRADLRVRISKVGMEKAYEEWLQREHGH